VTGGALLALNCGSSSVKFAVFGGELDRLLSGMAENLGTGNPVLKIAGAAPVPLGGGTHEEAIGQILSGHVLPSFGSIAAVGHRVVHGGTMFAEPVRIDPDVRRRIAELTPLAPLHQPHNLAGIDAISRVLPETPQAACFDTAFHRTIPPERQLMALPRRFAAEGLRRFGFHGLSYEHIAARLPHLPLADPAEPVIACHLGNGCSLAAIADGKCVHTSMGFTPLDGLVMGQRPGRLDPGAVLWLVERLGGVEEARRVLNRESGLLGISGISADMRVLLADGGEAARLAIDMFVDRLVQEIGMAAAVAGGFSGLVFTGGIGENAAAIRARVIGRLAWLGLELDAIANDANRETITLASSRRSAHVVAADEERVIAQAARRLSPHKQASDL
jgi:acetate kinase